MNDPYAMPNGVLRNKLGITDHQRLEAAEADITRAARDAGLKISLQTPSTCGFSLEGGAPPKAGTPWRLDVVVTEV